MALVEAWQADRWGNLDLRSSARNFNPVMATAAELTIVQTQHIVELGALDPEKIATPGIYVNRVAARAVRRADGDLNDAHDLFGKPVRTFPDMR